jgi:hypothetical protein
LKNFKKLRQEIMATNKEIKESIRKGTGAFKYDWVVDMCYQIFNKKLDKIESYIKDREDMIYKEAYQDGREDAEDQRVCDMMKDRTT